jgi:hypothetical protein
MGGAACSSTNAGVLRSKARIKRKVCVVKRLEGGANTEIQKEREREGERSMRESERVVIRHETVKKVQS